MWMVLMKMSDVIGPLFLRAVTQKRGAWDGRWGGAAVSPWCVAVNVTEFQVKTVRV